jgi:hypothetical protein
MTGRRQEDVNACVSVHRVLFLGVLDGADYFAVDLDYIAKRRVDELFPDLFIAQPAPPLRHLGLARDRAQSRDIRLGPGSQNNPLAFENHA